MSQSRTLLRYLHKLVPEPTEDCTSDRELLRRFADLRDEAAFTRLVRRHGPMVLSVCRRLLHNWHDAEDACQATFLVLASKAASRYWQTSVASWLHRVAYHLALKARAAAVRRVGQERQVPDRTVPDPLETITGRELHEILDAELARLPEKYRAPLVLCYLEGATRDEAARQLGCPLGTLKSRVERGRELLRFRLVHRGLASACVLSAAVLVEEPVNAALSLALWRRVAQAALSFTGAKTTTAGVVSARVLGLAEKTLRSMALTKLKVTAAVLLAVSVFAGGAGAVVFRALAVGQPTVEAKQVANQLAEEKVEPRPGGDKPAHTDRYGDPLPEEAIARLGTTRLRHPSVFFLRFAPDGKTLVANGDAVRSWDVATGKEIRSFPVDNDWRATVALSPDGKLLATSAKSGILLREIDGGRQARLLGTGQFYALCFSPDGRVLAGRGINPSRLELWAVSSGRQLHAWQGPDFDFSFIGFSKDGKTLITGGSSFSTIPPHPDNKFYLWDVASGKEQRHFSVGGGNLKSIALSPTAASLAFILWDDNNKQARIAIWDVATGKKVHEIKGSPRKTPWAGQVYFSALAFAPDGKTLLAGGIDQTLIRYDLGTGAEVARFGQEIRNPQALAFSADGKIVAVALPFATIRLIDPATGKDRLADGENLSLINLMALTPEGRTLVAASADALVYWDVATGRVRRRDKVHLDWIDALWMSRDGRTLVSKTYDRSFDNREVQVWDVATGKEVRRLPIKGPKGFHFLCPTTEYKTAALAATGGDLVILDLSTGAELQRLKCPADNLYGACFDPDGRSLIVWADDEVIRQYDVATGRELQHFSITVTPAAEQLVPTVVVSPDGRFLAVGRQTNLVTIHELATGRLIRRLSNLPDGTTVLAFSPDGKTLAWGEQRHPGIHLIELASGRERCRFSGQRGWIASLAFASDGKTLASASQDTTVVVWDLTGRLAAGDQWSKPLSPSELEASWNDLPSEDAARAYAAIRKLAAAPTQAVPYLAKRLQPVPAPDEKLLSRLLADLDSDQFKVRERATKELDRMGEVVVGACTKALKRGPSAEVRRRLELLLAKRLQEGWNPSPDHLRTLRAVEALELAGTAAASRLLETLAKGAAEARLTQEARASLDRLTRRPGTLVGNQAND